MNFKFMWNILNTLVIVSKNFMMIFIFHSISLYFIAKQLKFKYHILFYSSFGLHYLYVMKMKVAKMHINMNMFVKERDVLFNIVHLISRSVILAFFEGTHFRVIKKKKNIAYGFERHWCIRYIWVNPYNLILLLKTTTLYI